MPSSKPDIFLSYSRENQAIAQRFAEALQREAFSVWWDQALATGETYDEVTERALEGARAVVVLWSRAAVASRWVRAEATTADRNRTLMPVLIEDCKRPVKFELTQTADLSRWTGDPTDPAWLAFVRDVRRLTHSADGVEGSPEEAMAPAAAGAGSRAGPGSRRRAAWLVPAAIAAGLVLAGTFAWKYFVSGPAPAESGTTSATSQPATDRIAARVTLAVLPFANLSADAAQDYFSDGLTEEILNQLAQVPALRLTGRTSSFSFKGKNEDLREIGRRLGVANLLEGSVRRDGEQIRITAQLIRAEDGTHQWSKTYDRSLRNIFATQDEIARDVAQALAVKLDVTTLNRAQGGTTNVEAYDLYLRWRKLFLSEQTGSEALRQQQQFLREAVALDPQFAVAWDELGSVLERQARMSQGASSEQFSAEARQARQRVAQLAPDSWMVQRERAYSLWAQGKWQEAIAVARSIMDKGPFTLEHSFPYSNLIFAVGRIEETIGLVERVKAIEPLEMWVSRDLQWDLTALARTAEAEAEYERSKSLAGSTASPDIIALLRMLSRPDPDPKAVRALFNRVIAAQGSQTPQFLRDLADHVGDRAGMLASLHRNFEKKPEVEISAFADALGDAELALAGLRMTWKGPSPEYAKYWELFLMPYSGMRRLPGYKALLREVGLVDYWRKTGEWGDICRPVGNDDFECR